MVWHLVVPSCQGSQVSIFSSTGVIANWDVYLIVKLKEFCLSSQFQFWRTDLFQDCKIIPLDVKPKLPVWYTEKGWVLSLRTRRGKMRKMNGEWDMKWPQALPRSQQPFSGCGCKLTRYKVRRTRGWCACLEQESSNYRLQAAGWVQPNPMPLFSCGVQAGNGFYGWIFATDLMIENTNFQIQLSEN